MISSIYPVSLLLADLHFIHLALEHRQFFAIAVALIQRSLVALLLHLFEIFNRRVQLLQFLILLTHHFFHILRKRLVLNPERFVLANQSSDLSRCFFVLFLELKERAFELLTHLLLSLLESFTQLLLKRLIFLIQLLFPLKQVIFTFGHAALVLLL